MQIVWKISIKFVNILKIKIISCNPMFGGKRIVLPYVAVIGIAFASCSSGMEGKLPSYAVERRDYEDVLVMEGYTESVNSVNINCPPNVDGTIVNIVESGTYVKEGDVVCIIEDVGVANSFDRLTLDLESAYAELEKLKASQRLDSALLDAQVKNNAAEAMLAESDSLQMIYMSATERETKKLQLQRAAIERERLLKKVESTKVMQKIDLMRMEKHIAWVKRNLEAERKKMESLKIRATKDGLAVRGRRWPWSDETWNVGDNVWNGRSVVTLPDFDNMKVLLYAQETEYKRLHMGDSVMYTFDAMPENRGWGRIIKLASVGQTRTSGSQVKTFEIEASVDSLLAPIEPGLSARCHIYIKHIPDTIVVPTISVFDKDSLKVVYVQNGRKYEEREVTLGIGSPKMTIISNGLNEGEQIALIRPRKE